MSIELDNLGAALAVPGTPLGYSTATHHLTNTPGTSYNLTAAQISGIATAFNALSATLTASLELDNHGNAVAAPTNGGSGGHALAYSAATRQITYTSGITYNATAAEIQSLCSTFNTLSDVVMGGGAGTPPPPLVLPAVLPLLGFNTHRLSLFQDMTIYCNASSGSNTAGDGTATRPFKDVEYVWDMFMADYDLRRKKVTVRCQANMGFVNIAGRLTGQKDHTYFHIMSDNPAAPVSATGFMASAEASFWLSDMVLNPGADAIGLLAAGGDVFCGSLTINGAGARAGIYSIGPRSCITQYGGSLSFGGSMFSAIIGEDNGQLNLGGSISASGPINAFVRAGIGAVADLTGASVGGSISGLKAHAYQGGRVWTGGGGIALYPGSGAVEETGGGIV